MAEAYGRVILEMTVYGAKVYGRGSWIRVLYDHGRGKVAYCEMVALILGKAGEHWALRCAGAGGASSSDGASQIRAEQFAL